MLLGWTSWYRIRRMDWVSAAAVLLLMTAGVLFIFSAAFQTPDSPVKPFYKKQIVWCIAGLAAFLFVLILDYRIVARYVWWLYGISVALLILVLFIGVRVHGAYRWLNFFGIYFQPSELAKLITVATLAQYLGRPGLNRRSPWTVVQALLITAVPFVLILMEPDLGTAAVLLPVVFMMMFVAGVPLRYLLLLMVIGLALLPLGWFTLGDYQQERILVFLDPGRDPLGAGWNKIQSEIAVGSGGLWGKGYLQGTQNVLGFLPRTVAPTDFIFSVIAEETGFVGCISMVVLYLVLLGAGLRTAAIARDAFGRLLVVGLMTMLFVHVFVNMAMTVGLVPITGLPLPLISYGGSFMVSTMLALGLVQSVYARRFIN